jgi:hypothetical protein
LTHTQDHVECGTKVVYMVYDDEWWSMMMNDDDKSYQHSLWKHAESKITDK